MKKRYWLLLAIIMLAGLLSGDYQGGIAFYAGVIVGTIILGFIITGVIRVYKHMLDYVAARV